MSDDRPESPRAAPAVVAAGDLGGPPGARPQGLGRARPQRGLGAAAPRGRPRLGPDRHRARRRDDDHQHGSAAPLDPWGAAPHARARWRDRAADQAGRRLPAHRDGEDRRGAHLRPGRDQRHPHGLPVPAAQRVGLLARDRGAPRGAAPAPGHLDPHVDVRTEPGLFAPHVDGDQRDGPRLHLDDDLRLPRARARARVLREDDRPADEPQLHPPRWRRGGPARRLGGRRRHHLRHGVGAHLRI